jgi:hypothetical protein
MARTAAVVIILALAVGGCDTPGGGSVTVQGCVQTHEQAHHGDQTATTCMGEAPP